MIDIKEFLNNTDYDLAGEKFLMPDLYSDFFNYTIGKAFAISNEQLAKVFDNLNLTNKKVLTVGSSGDQVLNSILCGSKDVTIIDANIYSQYFIEYKLAFIKNLDFNNFKNLFIKPEFFDWKIYAKISHELSPKVKQFWDTLILEIDNDSYSDKFSSKTIKDNMLMVDHTDRHSLFYKDEKVYNKLQKLLKNADLKINYITAELEDFPKILNQKYHYINLSNIYDYYMQNKQKFTKIIEELYEKNLYNNGSMVVNYCFNAVAKHAPQQLGNLLLKHKEVSRYQDGINKIDTIWIVKKDKTHTKTYDLNKEK